MARKGDLAQGSADSAGFTPLIVAMVLLPGVALALLSAFSGRWSSSQWLPILFTLQVTGALLTAFLLHRASVQLATSPVSCRRARALAYVYAYTAVLLALRGTAFPAGEPTGGPLGFGGEARVALLLGWHALLPCCALTVLLLARLEGPVLEGVVLVVAAVSTATPMLLASLPRLPALVADGEATLLTRIIGSVVSVLSVVAALLWLRPDGWRPPVVERWVGMGLLAGAWGAILLALSQDRFTPLWWLRWFADTATFTLPALGLLASLWRLQQVRLAYEAAARAALAEELARGHRERMRSPELIDLTAVDVGADGRIERALNAGELRIVYQPIVDLTTGEAIGVEALARFSDGRSPDVWFREAATTGRQVDLELAAIRAALPALSAMPEPLFLSLNCSPTTLRAGLLDALRGSPSGQIVVEVTEHEAAGEEMAAALDDLRRIGVRLAIDDFGAGHANLSRILALRPDILKIDLSLGQRVVTDPVSRELLRAVAGFGRAVGARLVVEGIENDDQRRAARVLGVNAGQGFHLRSPGPLSMALQGAPLLQGGAESGLISIGPNSDD